MLPLGTIAPDFELYDTISDSYMCLDDLKSSLATVVMFICNHCPYVIHVNSELVKIANKYLERGISFIAISSNDIATYPQDGPLLMKDHAAKNNYPFPYLYDETQDIARAYQAACTPDFYVFDENMQLVYRGRMDDSSPGNDRPCTGADLRRSLECLIQRKEIDPEQYPSMGCNIKWKKDLV